MGIRAGLKKSDPNFNYGTIESEHVPNNEKCLSCADLLRSFGAIPGTTACGQPHLSSCPRCVALLRIIQELIRDEITPQETILLDRVKPPPRYQRRFRGGSQAMLRTAAFSRN